VINDRHMAVGEWSIDLDPNTPQWIRDEFRDGNRGEDRFQSWVCFSESDMLGADGTDLTQAVKEAFTDQVLWVGPVWRRGNKMRSFGGPSLMGYLDNARGGAMYNSLGGTPTFPATITQVIAAWFDPSIGGRNGIHQGGAASATSTTIDDLVDGSYLPPVKGPLDTLMAQTGNEYWIRPTGHIDWGTAANLFRSPPEVLIVEDAASDVLGYKTLKVAVDGIRVEEDIDAFRNAAKVVSQDYDFVTGSGSGSATAGSILGPQVDSWWKGAGATFSSPVIRIDSNDFSDVTNVAQIAADAYAYTNREITVECDDQCVLGYVQPGDWVYIYSPEDGVIDTDNEIEVSGSVIHPESVRVVAVRQPFTSGMGAHVVRFNSSGLWNITRITDYVMPESGKTRIEIGSPPRPSVPLRYQSVIR